MGVSNEQRIGYFKGSAATPRYGWFCFIEAAKDDIRRSAQKTATRMEARELIHYHKQDEPCYNRDHEWIEPDLAWGKAKGNVG